MNGLYERYDILVGVVEALEDDWLETGNKDSLIELRECQGLLNQLIEELAEVQADEARRDRAYLENEYYSSVL